MIEKLEYKGVWFLPENEENQIEGILTFDPNGKIRLELTGTFHEFHESIDEIDFLLGYTTNGKKITLYKCYITGRSMSFPGIPTTKYTAFYIFEGEHFKSLTDLKFYKICAKISKLEEWVNVWGHQISFNFETKETDVKYNIPAPIPFKINDNLNGNLSFSYIPDMGPKAEYKIIQSTELELSVNDSVDFSRLIDFVSQFKKFLTIGIFNDVYLKEIVFFSKSVLDENAEERQYEKPIKLFFVQNRINNRITEIDYHDFLFSYTDIKANFESIIQKWFAIADTLNPVINVLFETFANKSTFIENKFLNIIQALEIYHRRVKEDKTKLIDDFNKSLKPILSSLSEEQQEWLNSKMEYKYEPNLRNRLKELFAEFTIKPLSSILGSKKEIKALIEKTTVARNYYTHYSIELKDKAYHGQKLYDLSEKLRVLLVIVILFETGFEKNEIERLFSKNEYIYFGHLFKIPSR